MKRNLLFALALILATSTINAWKPTFVGHRGSLRGVMNTAEAYRNGADFYKYQGLECDVRVTKDGHYVISHDETLGSICDQDLNIAQSTLAELEAATLRQTRDGVAYTAKICTVEEYLDICVEKGCFPMIELKYATGINNNDMSNFPGLYELVKSKGLEEKAIFLTSMSKSIEYVKTHYPEATCQYLLSSDSDTKFEFCKKWKVNPSFQASAVNNSLVERYLNAGFQVAVWTVNSEANYKKYGEMGCFMMTCDYLRPYDMPDLTTPDPTIPREPSPDALPVEGEIVWTRCMSDATLPSWFPSKKGSTYTNAQQAAVVDGRFYVNDAASQSLLIMDKDCDEPVVIPFSETGLGGSPMLGIASDDAGNLIQCFEDKIGAAPSRVRLFAHGSTIPVTVDIDLGDGAGACNFINASGDIFSDEGGYIYFYPANQFVISAVHIANGRYVDTRAFTVMLRGATGSYVCPLNGPDTFLYMVRTKGFYLVRDGLDMGSVIATTSTTQPNRNSSVGGAFFTLRGHELMIHPSGANYNGGFTVRDLDADLEPLISFPVAGNGGSDVNPSYATFTRVEKTGDNGARIYAYTMGNGFGAYDIWVKDSGVNEIPAANDTFTAFPNPVISSTALCASKPLGVVTVYGMDGRLALTRDLGQATTASLDLSALPSGLYIAITSSGQRLRLAKR